MALAVHAQQLEDRLAHVEQRLEELSSDTGIRAVVIEADLLDVRAHSARLSAELTRVSLELQRRVDRLAEQVPAAVEEDRLQQRARTLAATILELSDSLDTSEIDLRDRRGPRAGTF